MANEWARGTFTADNITHTSADVMDAIESFLVNAGVGWEKASWSDALYGTSNRHYLRVDRATRERWQFDGDGPLQHGGIRVQLDLVPATTTGRAEFAGQTHIVIRSFLQNSAGTDRQVSTPDFVSTSGTGSAQSLRFGTIRLRYDGTAPNNWLLIGGEDGLYAEVGRDSDPTNLGHGAIMTFGPIPESSSSLDHTVQWTAQGLVCDLYDPCRFSANRNRRFVANDAPAKNFTAALQPYTPRGTRALDSPSMFDQNPYYIGSRDAMYGANRTGRTNTTNATVVAGTCNLDIHATFGLFNTPQNDRYRISPLLMLQSIVEVVCGTDSNSASDVAASAAISAALDPRSWRQIFRFAAVDYTILPFVNIQDAVTGATYRVARVEDGGRFSNLGIQWPSSTVTITL